MSNYNGKYIIVVGTNKAGTTSLFNYLAHHNSIQTSDRKQLDYFLDADYKLVKKVAEKRESYLDYFLDSINENAAYLLDVSPDYMYDTTTLKSIIEELDVSKLKIIFILRNPISRLQSWYNYGKQIEVLDDDLEFDEYLNLQKETLDSHMTLCAKKTGQYVDYIKPYFDALDPDQIHIGFFEELRDTPLLFIRGLMSFLDLNDDPYEEYEFATYNQSIELKKGLTHSVYSMLRSNALRISEKAPFLKSIITTPGRKVSKYYKSRFGYKPKIEATQSSEIKQLVEYYAASVRELELLSKRKAPWMEFN